ncbi:MAG: modification methylase [Candidatus Marinimicrobia bacterium]|nr:modification methylase [Candidatus Neomarinimicrobiota bacterium]MBT6472345.1 modification methylase [Candidatus Neomarinimicrobiota bacterium]
MPPFFNYSYTRFDYNSQNDAEHAIYLEYEGDKNGNNVPDPDEIGIKHFKGDGDFRSEECIELLKQADIVVTNPPFSLFREYVAQLNEYGKNFIIIGHQNAIKYNYVFKLIKEDKIWLGNGFTGGAAHFINRHYEDYAAAGDHKEGMIRVSGVQWFTNMDINKRHEEMILYKTYDPEEHLTYDNYDAINVNKTKEIPYDFDGAMGVPITFMNKYNPEQFEILGIFDDKREKSDAFIQGLPTYVDEQHKKYVGPVINGKALYTRILIRNKKVVKTL